MLSQELQQLIEAAIADGTITDKEREIIRNRAIKDGEDSDEVEMILDGKLQSKQKSTNTDSKLGDRKKCPNCGEIIPALSVSCPSCGYDFRNIEANSSSKKLAKKLEEVTLAYRDKEDPKIALFDPKRTVEYRMRAEKASVITNFPIPTTKDDIFEFIITMQTNSKSSTLSNDFQGLLQTAYKAKYKECVFKAKLLFPDDPRFSSFFEKKTGIALIIEWWSGLRGPMKFLIIYILALLGLVSGTIIVYIMYIIFH